MFTEADLTKALVDTGSKLGRKIAAYLIGGCAMTFMGRKVATKDVDIVFGSTRDTKDFIASIRLVRFEHVVSRAASTMLSETQPSWKIPEE